MLVLYRRSIQRATEPCQDPQTIPRAQFAFRANPSRAARQRHVLISMCKRGSAETVAARGCNLHLHSTATIQRLRNRPSNRPSSPPSNPDPPPQTTPIAPDSSSQGNRTAGAALCYSSGIPHNLSRTRCKESAACHQTSLINALRILTSSSFASCHWRGR